MSKGIYRAINFDLDTKAMQAVLGSRTKGYSMLLTSLKEFGFFHRQGSGYRSDKPMTRPEVDIFVDQLAQKNLWLAGCVKTFDITNSGKTDYSFADVIRAEAEAKRTSNEERASEVAKSKSDSMKKDDVAAVAGAASAAQLSGSAGAPAEEAALTKFLTQDELVAVTMEQCSKKLNAEILKEEARGKTQEKNQFQQVGLVGQAKQVEQIHPK